MEWVVQFHEDFEPEFERLAEKVQDELLARVQLIEYFGPMLKRPHVDTLKGSRHTNLKELRFDADGVWRVDFAFDPTRRAILLIAGNKSGISEKHFYKALIERADTRFDAYLEKLKGGG